MVNASFKPVVISNPRLEKVKIPPKVEAPVVDRVDNDVLPLTDNDEDKEVPDVTVRDPPIPRLPVVVKVVA